MSKKLILGALALAALLPAAASAQEQLKNATLAYAWDLDGEAADADQVIAATALVDSGTSVADANWTIVAQPDTCRLHNLTIVDTNLTAGTITVAGTGCLGEARTCSFAFAAGDDSGVQTLTCTDGEGAYFSNVATVTTGVMTGESDETFALGYAGVNSVNGWPMYGRLRSPGPLAEDGVDPFGAYAVNLPITTSAVLSTTVTSVSTNGAFNQVAVGDLLLIPIGGRIYERKVTAKASANSITINQSVKIPATGVTFAYKKMFFSTNPRDEMFIPVATYDTMLINWSVDANANTGGVITLVQCTDSKQPDFPTSPWVEISTTTVNSGATKAATPETINLTTHPYTFCRVGMRFGTGDDGDGSDEDINLSVVLLKQR